MNRIKNILARVTGSLSGISVVSFGISALSAAIGADVVVGLFGYMGIYSGLTMIVTGSIMSIISLFDAGQEYLHHAASTASHGMI